MLPTIIAASLLVIFDNGLNYSIQQTGRESLYLITTAEEKHKARAFLHMFILRLAKGLSAIAVIGLGMVSTASIYLGLITIGIMNLMALFGIYAGQQFNKATRKEGKTVIPITGPFSPTQQGPVSDHIVNG